MKKLTKYLQYIDNHGISQSERNIDALNTDYFLVDEQQQSDFINYLLKFSELIGFYNQNDVIDGNWSDFFANDQLVLLVQISSSSTNPIDEKYTLLTQQLIKETKNDIIENYFSQLLEFLYELFITIQKWNEKTELIKEFNQEIKKLIKFSLSSLFSKLSLFEEMALENELIPKKLKINLVTFSRDWDVNPMGYDPYQFEGVSIAEKIKNSLRFIDILFSGIFNNMRLIVEGSRKYLFNQLNVNQEVSPHIALFFSFIEIYKNAQNEINNFTERHLDYYFGNILHFQQQPEIPDKIHLIFELQSQAKQYLLEKGTKLSAGKDKKGNDIIYEIDFNVVLNQAKLRDIKSVVLDNHIKTDSEKTLFQQFSIIQPYQKEIDYTKRPNIGFAIASTLLNLEEGMRRISLRIQFQRFGFDAFLRELTADYPTTPDNLLTFLNDSFNNFFIVLFSSGQEIETHWNQVDGNNVECTFQTDKAGNVLAFIKLLLIFEPHEAPITPCIDNRFSDAVANKQPVFQLCMNPNKSHLYPYVRNWLMEEITMETDILGIKNLKLQNDYSVLEQSAPFFPFSVTPSIGSSFYIGHKTLFSKPLNELYLNFEWFDVPSNDNGFPEYYAGYKNINSNEAFKATIQILKKKVWIPEENPQEIELFESVDLEEAYNTPINNFRGVTGIKTNLLEIDKNTTLNESVLYDDSTRNGYIKLTLTGPIGAFGHKEYPDVVRDFTMRNRKKKKLPPSPNAPYNPTMKSVSIDYSTTSKLNLSEKQLPESDYFYYIHPFGIEQVSKNLKTKPTSLLPVYDNGTEIYLGIEELFPPQTISLFFQIDEYATDFVKGENNLHWSFLYNNQWIPLKEENILRDTGNELMQAGILLLDIPKPELYIKKFSEDFNNQLNIKRNVRLPEGFFWLRLKSPYGQRFVDSIIDIQIQAAMATFANNNNDLTHLQTKLPAETITNLLVSSTKIKSIKQPYPSFGGRDKEERKNFYRRVSERLQHKDRAINRWDYEAMVLEYFPEVYRVKCLNNTNETLLPEAGNVMLVVLPSRKKLQLFKQRLPKLSEARLTEIQQLVSDKISPFVTLHVKNPKYEEIQVKLNIKFHKGYDAKYYMNVIQEDICKLISPWLYDENIVVDFSNSIGVPPVLYFLETREYVDFFTNFALYHIVDGKIVNHASAHKSDLIIKPLTPVSVFVTATHHLINLIDDDTELSSGIGDMTMGADFRVFEPIEKEIDDDGLENFIVDLDFEVEKQAEKPNNFRKFRLTFID